MQYTKLQKQQWHLTLAPYFNEYAIAESSLADEASRQPINQSIIDIIAPYKPAVVSFHFGLPAPFLLEQIKSWGQALFLLQQPLKRQNGLSIMVLMLL